MTETSHESVMVKQFLRRHFVRIVIGAVLVVAVYGLLTVWMPYQREQRIAREIEALGGIVQFEYCGPEWMPHFVRERLPCFDRICGVTLDFPQVTDAGLEHLKGLTNLSGLFLSNTQVTDAGVEHLKGLTSLEVLALDNTQVTDASVKHLKGLTKLRNLRFFNTKTTAEGRATLRMALPNCHITS